MSQIYFGVYILPLIPHPPLLSRAPLELGGVGAVTFPPWGNSDRSRQGLLGSQAAACPQGTMLPSAAGRAGSTDHLSSGVQTTAKTPPVLPPQAARAAQTERRSSGMRALTRSTSWRPRSPRCRSRVHAHSQLCPAACQSLHRRSVPLAAKVRGSAPPQPFPCPGRVTCPRGGPRPRAQPRPSAGPALPLQLRRDGDPAERGQDWSRQLSARAGLGLSQSHSASCFWTTLAREPTMASRWSQL